MLGITTLPYISLFKPQNNLRSSLCVCVAADCEGLTIHRSQFHPPKKPPQTLTHPDVPPVCVLLAS